MKRREFLAISAAVAATPMLTRAGLAKTTAPVVVRRWDCSPDLFDIVLSGTSLAVHCLAPETQAPGATPDRQPRDEAMVLVGPRRKPVSWDVQSWEQPDPFSQRLVLRARDDIPLLAEVRFDYDRPTRVVTGRTELRNSGRDREVDVRATVGLLFKIHEPIRRMVYLTGGWENEAEIQRTTAIDEPIILESRAGKTGFDFQPYVALQAGSRSYICQIFWSGNWALQVVPDEDGATVHGGLNNWKFRHRLRAGDPLVLPIVMFGRFDGSPTVAVRSLHDHRRKHRPDPDRVIPVQYNSWYPYQGDPTSDALLPLVPLVHRIGCEAFVIDAGWYRTDDGDSDADWDARTGDWRTSRSRFPNGLREISARCRELGMRFGLWFEPEVIAPSSSIRRDHPEWLHHIDGHLPPTDRRAVLNLGVPAAWDHVFGRVTRMLRNVQVDWMKWDFNEDLGSGGWAPTLPKRLIGQAPLVAHYHGLYRMQDAIRATFPDLILEMCAGGGGRMDGEILSHAHVNWISDEIGALRKLAIHFGTQLDHPAVVCNDWLVDWAGSGNDEAPLKDPRGDLAFRLRVAMLGSFGISAPIDRWPDADIDVVADHVALYKDKLRRIIHHGDQYYMTQPPPPDGNGDWAGLWYLSKDASAGVLFAFRLAGTASGRVFRLPGLLEESQYRVSYMSGETVMASGAELSSGMTIELPETFRSELCLIEVVTDKHVDGHTAPEAGQRTIDRGANSDSPG
jgi:alpha-galactosidase